MKHSEQNKMHVLKEKFMTVRDWIMEHNKIVMPLVLIVCVLITVVAAVNANQKEALQKEAQQAAMAVASEETTTSIQGLETPVFELEENAHPEINNLVKTYYDAQASGDMETISSLNTYLNDIEKIRVQELSKYIDSYPEINVYTKPGLTENTYVAYVCSEVQFSDVDVPLPGMQTYYIGMNGDGNYFINDGTYDESIQAYIKKITLQDDVVDLNNKIVVEYNELLAEDEELSEFIAYLKEKINEDVGEILAEVEQPAQEENPADTENADAETSADTAQNVVKTVRTTDVVNIRKSDSEEADKIDKAQIGQEFTLLEERGNGWSKIQYNGGEAFIKSDYLEVVDEEIIETTGTEQRPEESSEQAASSNENANESTSGTVKVIESVRVRKSAGTDGEVLGTVYAGTELDLIMKQADGWTKVKYKGQTAYVKSEYVE
ncbi:MAG: SH3 domain-containing protein [Bacillota bacterium]|nr:SH3 domain-containing protein [Bacillota bacterium]